MYVIRTYVWGSVPCQLVLVPRHSSDGLEPRPGSVAPATAVAPSPTLTRVLKLNHACLNYNHTCLI